MSKNKKQKYEGIVYSTLDDFDYSLADDVEDIVTLPNSEQNLKVKLDRRFRKGKVVTIIEGFVGQEEDLNVLAKKIKQKCGVGGSVKDGDIIIQGDVKDKVMSLLLSENFKAKLSGG